MSEHETLEALTDRELANKIVLMFGCKAELMVSSARAYKLNDMTSLSELMVLSRTADQVFEELLCEAEFRHMGEGR